MHKDVHPDTPTMLIPIPMVAPMMIALTADGVKDVWDTYIKPGQDAGRPQSVEERCLMAILRAVYAGLS